jgi:hypothetical protein
MAAKRATATSLIEAISRTGWNLQLPMALIVDEAFLLALSDPAVACRGALWSLSSWLAGELQKDTVQQEAPLALCKALDMSVTAARLDDATAANMPAAYDWLELLTGWGFACTTSPARYELDLHATPCVTVCWCRPVVFYSCSSTIQIALHLLQLASSCEC